MRRGLGEKLVPIVPQYIRIISDIGFTAGRKDDHSGGFPLQIEANTAQRAVNGKMLFRQPEQGPGLLISLLIEWIKRHFWFGAEPSR